MRFDGDRARVDAERLSFPRRTGSSAAETAREYVVASLRAAGLDPAVEEFTFSRFLTEGALPLALLAVAGVVLTAALTYPTAPGVSLALLAFGFLAGLPATRWTAFTERMLDVGACHRSANIVAELPTPGADRHLILMAHTDSKSQRVPIWTRIIAAGGVLLGGLVLSAGALLASLRTPLAPPAGLVLAAGCVSTAGLLFLGANRSGDLSPGAVDNATGIALLMELARDLSGEGLRHTRVTFVATGAEEDGLAGSVRFFQQHRQELGPAPMLLNLDSLGAGGPVAIMSRYGIPPAGTGGTLARTALEVAAAEGIPATEVLLPAGAATDHFPAACRRVPAITLASLGPGLRRVHSRRDTASLVAWEKVDAAGRLALALIMRLDAAAE